MTATDTHLAIEAVFRIEQAKLIAVLARMVRDVGIAEDLAQEALTSHSNDGRNRASLITRAPGSWRPRSVARSIFSAGTSCSNANMSNSVAS